MMKKILLLSILNISYGTDKTPTTPVEETCKKCPVAWSDYSKYTMITVTVVVGLNQLTGLWINLAKIFCCKDKSKCLVINKS